jgi:hypothetical protein
MTLCCLHVPIGIRIKPNLWSLISQVHCRFIFMNPDAFPLKFYLFICTFSKQQRCMWLVLKVNSSLSIINLDVSGHCSVRSWFYILPAVSLFRCNPELINSLFRMYMYVTYTFRHPCRFSKMNSPGSYLLIVFLGVFLSHSPSTGSYCARILIGKRHCYIWE